MTAGGIEPPRQWVKPNGRPHHWGGSINARARKGGEGEGDDGAGSDLVQTG